jgi:hypothetical protein
MENFKNFVTGQKTEWNVPVIQRLLNWISVITLIAAVAILMFRKKL